MNTEQIDEFIKKLEKQKEEQSTIDTVVANLYAKRCKKSKEELLQLMSKDSWLTAKQALEWGFVDEITDDAEDKEPLSESTAAAMSSAGMPLPPGFKGKKGSLINRFFDFLRSINHQDSAEAAADEEAASVSETEIPQDMNTESTPAQQEQQSAAPAQSDQAQQPQSNDTEMKPAAPVSDKDAEIASLKQQLADRDRTISELRKEPAAPTSSVVESKKGDQDPYAPVSEAEGIAASKAFLENF